VVRQEPFREAGYQRLMQAHAMLGNRAEVRRVYERCRMRLREEVGLDPLPELEALYQTLQHQPSSVNPGG
jgi:LuxR family maltose regulon positive regulatory protein